MPTKITQIRKRDDRIVKFDQEKITLAVKKALEAVGEVKKIRKTADKLASEVIRLLEKKFHERSIPAVEEIQDIIEEVLMSNKLIKTAKAFILYREQHARIREMEKLVNSDEIMEGYLARADWRVKENANMDYSLQGLNNHVASTISSHYWLNKIYPEPIRRAHSEGDFHLHDLQLIACYCCGWDLKDLISVGFGGVTGKVWSKPPKHLRTALGQVVNFFYTMQGETAGAQAMANFDTYLAPFIRYDGLDHKKVKQALQEFLFNMNVPTRVGFQSLCYDELVVVKEKEKIRFKEIGRLVDEQFKKNSHRVMENNPQSFAIENYDDYQTLSFNEKGEAVWAPIKAFIRHRVPRHSEFVKIRTSRGQASVSRAHSLFSFKKLDGSFKVREKSALQIKPSHFNAKINPDNSFVALKSIVNQGTKSSLDLLDIVKEFSLLHKNIFVKINPTRTIEKIKTKVIEEYQGFLPFYIDFGLKDRGVWQTSLASQTIRYDIWQQFGDRTQKIVMKLKNSKEWIEQILNGRKLNSFVELCAWYISEGHNTLGNAFCLSQSTREEIEDLMKNLGIYGYTEKSKGHSEKGTKLKPVYKIFAKGLLANLISLSCGTYSKNKVIPWFIYELLPFYQEKFIKTLFKGDAAEYQEHWDYTTTSKKLSLSLSLLLAQNGYKFSVYEEDMSKKNKNWSDQYIIRIYKNKKAQENYSVVDFAARICSQVEKFNYDKEYEYDLSVDLPTENFSGGSGLLMFHNTPFTNITFDLMVPKQVGEEAVMIGGEPQKEQYKDFQEEVDLLNEVYAELMLEGDARGRVFSWPIPTYNISRDFDWDNGKIKNIWEMTAKYGIPYFANFVNSDMDPGDARSMCCRLRLDNRELRKRGGGLFGANPLTGSIGVATINMPRLGYLSKDQEEFNRRLIGLMNLAYESLELKRKTLERLTENGLYPYSRFYLRSIKERFGTFWQNHFSTIGLNGLNEACVNLLGKNIASPEGHKFAEETLNLMREKLMDYQKESNNLYNLEATPAEGTSYRFAKIDKKKYADIIVANEESYQYKSLAPYYTNSSQLPVNYTDDIFEALDLQDNLQIKYTGGTVLHGFVGEKMPSGESVKKLVKKIATNYHLPYFTITPTFSICPKHGYLAGEHKYCPECDQEIGYVIREEKSKLAI